MTRLANRRRSREGAGLSREQLGARAGTSRWGVELLEAGTGHAAFRTLRALAAAHGVTPVDPVAAGTADA